MSVQEKDNYEDSPTCEHCGGKAKEPVNPVGTVLTICQSCYTHWDIDSETESAAVRWEKHIAEINYDYRNSDRHCTFASVERGEAMTGVYQRRTTFLGIDSKGRIIVSRGDCNRVDLMVPLHLNGFSADAKKVQEQSRDGIPRMAQKPAPRFGQVGHDPLAQTPSGNDHLYELELIQTGSDRTVAQVLLEIEAEQGLEELSSAGYTCLKNARIEGAQKVAEEYKPPLKETNKKEAHAYSKTGECPQLQS